MENNSELLIYDDEFSTAKTKIIEYGEGIANLLERYNTMIEVVLTTAIQDKLITEALLRLEDKIKPIQKRIIDWARRTGAQSTEYITKIDEADKFLY